MKEACRSQINILVIQPFLKISSLHSVHKAFPCRTVPRLCCFQGQISALLPALHYLPASAAITTNNHSTQGISPVSPNRNSCGEETKTHSVQAPWQRKAGSLGTAISSSDKWSQQHTGLSLVLPAGLVNLPAENTSLTVALRWGSGSVAWDWVTALGAGTRLAEIPGFGVRSLSNCLQLPAQLWPSVLPAAKPSEVRALTVSSLCSDSSATQKHILKLLWKGSTDPTSWICCFIFQR